MHTDDKTQEHTPALTMQQTNDFFKTGSERGYEAAIREIKAQGVSVDTPINEGQTLLFLTAQANHMEALHALIVAKADVNLPDSNGRTSIFIAAANGHIVAVQALIAANADVNKRILDGSTPLHLASFRGHIKVVHTLISARADVNALRDGFTPLSSAVQAIYELTKPRVDGLPPSTIASLKGHIKVIRTLIDAGENVNRIALDGSTPFYTAILSGEIDVVKMLLKKADIKLRLYGKTPLEIVNTLIQEKNPKAGLFEIRDLLIKHEKELKRLEENTAKKEQAKLQAQKNQVKNLLMDSLHNIQGSLTGIQDETKALAKLRKSLQADIFTKILASTAKLEKTLEGRKNNERLPTLTNNETSLNELSTLNPAIKTQGKELLMMIDNFSKLCKGLLGRLSEEEQKALIEKSTLFSQTREALTGEVDDTKDEILKKTSEVVQKEWNSIQEKYKMLSELIHQVKEVNVTLDKRIEKVADFREAPSNTICSLKQETLKTIKETAERIREKIAAQEEADLMATQAAQDLAKQLNKTSVSRNARRSSIEISHVTEPAPDIRETTTAQPTSEASESTKKISKEERRLAYLQMHAQEQECLRVSLERVTIDYHRARTEAEIEKGQVPVPERGKKMLQKPIEQSTLFKVHLEQLESVISALKNNNQGTSEELYALLGSLGQINDIIVQENKHSTAVFGVAKRLRNAIFKQHESIQRTLVDVGKQSMTTEKNQCAEVNDKLLEIADCWCKFLRTDYSNAFEKEEAVLEHLQSDSLLKVFDLGKTLDIDAKNDEEHWKIVVENIDINKSMRAIDHMQAYWKNRQNQKTQENLIQSAADDFYWAIMGSELVALKEAKKQGKPAAYKALKKLKALTPYLSEFRDRGVLARHPATKLERAKLLFVLGHRDSLNTTTSSPIMLLSQVASRHPLSSSNMEASLCRSLCSASPT